MGPEHFIKAVMTQLMESSKMEKIEHTVNPSKTLKGNTLWTESNS